MTRLRKKFIAFFPIGLLAAGIVLYGLFRFLVSPVHSGDTSPVRIVVPKGKGITWVGNTLEKAGVIRSAYLFRYAVWRRDVSKSIQAGSYTFTKSQNLSEIVLALTKGTDDLWVTIVEGVRVEEIAETLKETFGDTFDAAAFLKVAKPKEGFLFPDTYLLPRETTPSLVLSTLTTTYAKRVTPELKEAWKNQGLSEQQAVILASLVQREARRESSMKIVAGILLKRLHAGWPLQVDATLQYIRGYDEQEKTWWSQPTAADKKLKSPYNTYLHTGLPPGPISNPGLDALRAVAYPEDTEFWYYITDLEGQMHYAKTVEEHNANVRQYLK